MEAAFWRTKLSLDKEENNSLERLHKWLATGHHRPRNFPYQDSYDFICCGKHSAGPPSFLGITPHEQDVTLSQLFRPKS